MRLCGSTVTVGVRRGGIVWALLVLVLLSTFILKWSRGVQGVPAEDEEGEPRGTATARRTTKWATAATAAAATEWRRGRGLRRREESGATHWPIRSNWKAFTIEGMESIDRRRRCFCGKTAKKTSKEGFPISETATWLVSSTPKVCSSIAIIRSSSISFISLKLFPDLVSLNNKRDICCGSVQWWTEPESESPSSVYPTRSTSTYPTFLPWRRHWVYMRWRGKIICLFLTVSIRWYYDNRHGVWNLSQDPRERRRADTPL